MNFSELRAGAFAAVLLAMLSFIAVGTPAFAQAIFTNQYASPCINSAICADGSAPITGPGDIAVGNLDVGNSAGTVVGAGTLTVGAATLTASSVAIVGYNNIATATVQAGGTLNISSLAVGRESGAGTFTLNAGGSLTVTGFLGVGDYTNSRGTFIQSGGINQNADLAIGYGTGTGTYDLSGGQLSTTGTILVGDSGSGTFNQSGNAIATAGTLLVGGFTGCACVDTYKLGGSGSLTVTGDATVESGSFKLNTAVGDNALLNVIGTLLVGSAASGTFIQSGGTLNTGNLVLSGVSGVTGTFNQSGNATVITGGLTVGNNVGSNGTYTLGGSGSLTVNGDAYVGFDRGSTGTFNFNTAAGDHAALTITGNLAIGTVGTGTFNQGAGINQITGQIVLAGGLAASQGTYNLSGGTLASGVIRVGVTGVGVFTQSGAATATVSGLNLGGIGSGNGTYTLGGTGSLMVNGDVNVGNNTGATGTFKLNTAVGDNAALNVTGNLTVGKNGSGTATQGGGVATVGGTLTIAANLGSSAVYTLQGGTLNANTIQVNQGGSFAFNGGTANFSTFNLAGGAVTASGDEVLDTAGQSNSTYNFNQSNGSNTVSSGTLVVGAAAGNTGGYNLSGGTLTTANETVGGSGNGMFTQTGAGTNNTMTGDLTIAANPGSNGAYNLFGGTLNADHMVINSGGNFIQIGGTATFTGDVTNAGGRVLIIGPGTTSVTGGKFTQTGLTGSLLLNGGTLNASGGVFAFGGIAGGFGTINGLTGGVTVDGATFQVGASPDALHVVGNFSETGGSIDFEVDPDGHGGFLESSLIFDHGANVQITDTDIVFNFVNGADPLAFFDSGQFNLDHFFYVSDGTQFSVSFPIGSIFDTDFFSAQSTNFAIADFAFDPETGATTLTEVPLRAPEPGTLLLFAGGLAALRWALRRRKPAKCDGLADAA